MARVDATTVRLAVAFNTLKERNLVDSLPQDLRGLAIPNLVLEHEKAKLDSDGAHGSESGLRTELDQSRELTHRLLVRIRHAVLASFGDADDPRVAALGPLGTTENADGDLARLTHLSVALKSAHDSGDVALVADLLPARLSAHAVHQVELAKGKATLITGRQVESTDLANARKVSAKTLQRVKNFIKSFLGDTHLEAFGFGIPAPAVRPRLVAGEDPAPAPPAPPAPVA